MTAALPDPAAPSPPSTAADSLSPAARDALRRQRPWVIVALLVYALIQAIYITATPLQRITLPDNFPTSASGEPRTVLTGIGPDEKEYLVYVLSLAERGRLPAPMPDTKRSPDDYVSYQAQHPPLFFAVAALLDRVFGLGDGPGFWYGIRILCALCGAGVVVLAARAAAIAFPDRPLVFLAAAPMVALTPMFGHLMANLSNEPLAMLFATAAWLRLARVARADHGPTVRNGILIGALLGLAALTRLTALMWLPAAIIVLFAGARRARTNPIPPLAAFVVAFGLLLAPWLVRNLIVYGTPLIRTFDRPLLAYGSVADFLGPGIVPPNAPMVVRPLTTALWYASTALFPYWLVQFYLPPAGLRTAQAWQAICLIAEVAIGLLLFLHASRARRGEEASDPQGRVILWASGVTVAFCVVVLLQQQFFSDWNVINSAGRYIAAAIPASAILVLFARSAVGTLRRPDSGRAHTVAAVTVFVLLAFIDLYVALLVQRYYRDNPAQSAIQPIQQAQTGAARGTPLA